MERIVIEVDEPTATAFGKFSPKTKNRFNESVSIALKKMINNVTAGSHKKFLDDLSAQAEKNGLTEEILNDLLRDDD